MKPHVPTSDLTLDDFVPGALVVNLKGVFAATHDPCTAWMGTFAQGTIFKINEVFDDNGAPCLDARVKDLRYVVPDGTIQMHSRKATQYSEDGFKQGWVGVREAPTFNDELHISADLSGDDSGPSDFLMIDPVALNQVEDWVANIWAEVAPGHGADIALTCVPAFEQAWYEHLLQWPETAERYKAEQLRYNIQVRSELLGGCASLYPQDLDYDTLADSMRRVLAKAADKIVSEAEIKRAQALRALV